MVSTLLPGSASMVRPRSPAVSSGLRVPQSGWVMSQALTAKLLLVISGDPRGESRQYDKLCCSRVSLQRARSEHPQLGKEPVRQLTGGLAGPDHVLL